MSEALEKENAELRQNLADLEKAFLLFWTKPYPVDKYAYNYRFNVYLTANEMRWIQGILDTIKAERGL